MDISKLQCKINKLAKTLGFDTLMVMPYHTKFGLDSFHTLSKTFSLSGTGYYEWVIGDEYIYLTDMVFEYSNLPIDFRGSYIELLSQAFSPESLVIFLNRIIIRLDRINEESSLEIKIFSKSHKDFRWLNIISKITIDPFSGDLTVSGMMQDITDYKLAKEALEDSKDILYQILNAVPLPVIYSDKNHKVQFLNNAVQTLILNDVELTINEDFYEYKNRFRNKALNLKEHIIFDKNAHKKYELDLEINNQPYNIIIDNLNIQNKKGESVGEISVYSDITERVISESKLTKLLKANQLSIEIKDMIDKVDDLTVIYDLILSKISEVIPNANKGCILKIDDDNNMRIISSEGFSDDYTKSFNIPFANSYACNNLKGNFSRSVIVNDIQNKYNKIFPEIVTEKRGFVINSNITAPISVDNKLYGLLSIDSEKTNAFDELDLNLIDYLRIQIERTINRHNKFISAMKDSQVDPLTGTYNRRHLMDAFDDYVQHAKWQNERFSFVVFDLDGLKKINDRLGHLAGDKVLVQFSSLVKTEIRLNDVFARYGGDEFVCLFFNEMSDSLISKIESWQDILLENEILVSDTSVQTKFSYGVSCYPADGEDFKTLMAVADKRMYKNKAAKKIKIGD